MNHLRQAKREDASAIRKLVLGEHLNPMSLDWRHFVLAVDGTDRLMGCVQLKRHGDGSRELASLAVVPQARGQGIARRLVEQIQSKNPPPLYLTCRSSMEPFYVRFGFRALTPTELPPYFRRLWGVFCVLRKIFHMPDGLSVMIWE